MVPALFLPNEMCKPIYNDGERSIAYLASAIQKGILIQNIHWLCFPKTTRSQNPDPSCLHLVTSSLNHANSVAQVASQCNIGSPLLRSIPGQSKGLT